VSFDLIAPWFQTLESVAFGNSLQHCRIACLREIKSPRRVLLAGEANGRFLSELLQLHPEVEVDCLDASHRMLELARQRINRLMPGNAARVRFLHRDIKSWVAPKRQYDLVATHFFLDCFPEPDLSGIIKKLSGVAKDDATWLLSDFRVPHSLVARLRAQSWLATMYLFFRVTARIEASELIDPTPFMRHEGFVLERQQLSQNGMLKSEIWRKSANAILGGAARCGVREGSELIGNRRDN